MDLIVVKLKFKLKYLIYHSGHFTATFLSTAHGIAFAQQIPLNKKLAITMAKLQEPKHEYISGGLRLWHEVTLHIVCEAVKRNVNVFEDLKSY